MRDITQNVHKITDLFNSQCDSFKAGACIRPEGCRCALRAEVWAYIYGLIPPEYHNLEIDDFTGHVAGQDFKLNANVVRDAKRRLVAYCWGSDTDLSSDFRSPELMKKSKIADRRTNGQSLCIHGNDYEVKNKTTKEVFTVRRKLGRSFLAAIVMKEIIRRRVFEGHAADTYDWVQFPTLKARVLAKDADATFEYQTCDWLVVDSINKEENATAAMRAYQNSMLDTVFMERIESRLPTILVCQFDVTEIPNLEDYFGVGLSQLIRDSNTLKISLTQNKKGK